MFNVTTTDRHIKADFFRHLPIYDGTGDEVGMFTGTIVWNPLTKKTAMVIGTAGYHIHHDYANNPTLDNFELNSSPSDGGGIINFLAVK